VLTQRFVGYLTKLLEREEEGGNKTREE